MAYGIPEFPGGHMYDDDLREILWKLRRIYKRQRDIFKWLKRLEWKIKKLKQEILDEVNKILDERFAEFKEEIIKMVENMISELEKRVETLETTMSEVQTKISIIEQKVDDHEKRIQKNADDIAALDTRVTRNEADIADLQNRVAALEQCCTEVQQTLDTINQNIDSLKRRVSTLEDDVSDIKADILAIQGYINTINNSIANIQNDISSIQSTLSNHETRITALENATPPSSGGVYTRFFISNTQGNDSTGDGTVNKPFATINGAISANSQNNAYLQLIFLTSGNYSVSTFNTKNLNLEMRNDSTGNVALIGNASEIIASSLDINSCNIEGIKFISGKIVLNNLDITTNTTELAAKNIILNNITFTGVVNNMVLNAWNVWIIATTLTVYWSKTNNNATLVYDCDMQGLANDSTKQITVVPGTGGGSGGNAVAFREYTISSGNLASQIANITNDIQTNHVLNWGIYLTVSITITNPLNAIFQFAKYIRGESGANRGISFTGIVLRNVILDNLILNCYSNCRFENCILNECNITDGDFYQCIINNTDAGLANINAYSSDIVCAFYTSTNSIHNIVNCRMRVNGNLRGMSQAGTITIAGGEVFGLNGQWIAASGCSLSITGNKSNIVLNGVNLFEDNTTGITGTRLQRVPI